MVDWAGWLDYRRRNVAVNTGDSLLFDPGELFRAEIALGRPGSFHVLEIAPETFESQCRAEGHEGSVHFSSTVIGSPELCAALEGLKAALLRDAEPLEQQSRLAWLAHAALSAGVERSRRALWGAAPIGPCAKLRELLHDSDASHINLSDFARTAGVSQFQLLRAFKRYYGAPPHTYSIQLRIARARRLLNQGFTVAETAAATGFTDQSHLARHFRRVLGVAPGRYAQTGSHDLRFQFSDGRRGGG
jgi:AraC-like DNA-binding protein